MEFYRNNNTLTIITATKRVVYSIFDELIKANEQQFNLPDGQKITYPDGSMILHAGEYALIRNWKTPKGTILDRIAVPWCNLFLEC